MRRVKQVAFSILLISGVAFTESATAQGVDVQVGVGFPLAPGQASTPESTSPGQLFKGARTSGSDTAVSPGQLYQQQREADPITAVPPGHTFTNPGRSKK
jgi:hypothetical protein